MVIIHSHCSIYSWFMSPGFTPTHALVLLDLLLHLQSYLTCKLYRLILCSDDHFPFPLSVSAFRFLRLQLSLYAGPLCGGAEIFLGWRQHFGAKIQLGTTHQVHKLLSAIRKFVIIIIKTYYYLLQ